MSNKSRLQTNNTNLQALIDKANMLPDASGSSGSVETCTVTVIQSDRLATTKIYYTNENCKLCSDEFTAWFEGQAEYSVIKNTIICFSSTTIQITESGSVTSIDSRSYAVTGDATFTLSTSDSQ